MLMKPKISGASTPARKIDKAPRGNDAAEGLNSNRTRVFKLPPAPSLQRRRPARDLDGNEIGSRWFRQLLFGKPLTLPVQQPRAPVYFAGGNLRRRCPSASRKSRRRPVSGEPRRRATPRVRISLRGNRKRRRRPPRSHANGFAGGAHPAAPASSSSSAAASAGCSGGLSSPSSRITWSRRWRSAIHLSCSTSGKSIQIQ